MAHYARISNIEFTKNERAKIDELRYEKDLLEANMESTDEIDEQITSLCEKIKNSICIVTKVFTGVDEYTPKNKEDFEGKDNTEYWEGVYGGCKRASYNTRLGVHQLGGTPFRKNYPGVGWIYDPIRDAFYEQSPGIYWTLDEDSCTWNPPTGWIQDEYDTWIRPVEKPEMGADKHYVWDQENLTWKKI